MQKTLVTSLVFALVFVLFSSMFFSSVSASSNQILWGAWVGGSSGHIDGHKMPYSTLTDFESAVGKDVSIWNWVQLWNRAADIDNCPTFRADWMDSCRNNGIIPMVSWSPEASDEDPNFSRLQDIVDGKEDAYLRAWGQASAAWNHPYFIRLMWEFTGTWTDYKVDPADPNNPNNPNNVWGYGIYPWSYQSSYGNGNTPAIFVAAWRHIVDTVRAAGGTQISWVWCPAGPDSASTLRSVYPGDNYVDWISADIYMDVDQQGNSYINQMFSSMREVAPSKPVAITEMGIYGESSGSFWHYFLTEGLPNTFPYIKALVIWEMPSNGWTVLNSQFRQGIATNYYTSSDYSNLNVSPIDALNSVNPTNPPTSTPWNPTPTPTSTTSPTTPSENAGFNIILQLEIITVIVIITGFATYTQIKKAPKNKLKRKRKK